MGSTTSFLYRASGLLIHADRPIAGLRPVASAAEADLHLVMRGSVDAPRVRETDAIWYASPHRDERGVPSVTIRRLGSDHLLCYSEGTQFLVNASGSRVDAWWNAPLTDVDAADYVLGGVLAFVSRLRGMVPLHASAVVIGGRAVLFAGAAGAGKSSTAAAFAILGVPVLADDIVAMADAADCVLAYPSHSRLSVWSDSAQELFAGRTLPTHSDAYLKHCVDLAEPGYCFHEEPVPIERILILSDRTPAGQLPEIRTLTPQAALVALVTHTYGNYLLDGSMRAREFHVLGRIAAGVGVDEISIGDGLGDLVSSCRLLARDLALQSAVQAT